MTEHLLNSAGKPAYMSEETSKVWIHTFVAATYLTPIIGAVLSDWLIGKYRMILYVSLLYCVGHGVLACMDIPGIGIEPVNLLFCGLALIAVGAGGIKPCVSANVGDQFTEKNKHLLPYVFSLFYFSINFGSFFATLLIPILLANYGSAWAFGVPGLLMALATLVFWLGSPYYNKVPPAGDKFLAETFSSDGIRAMMNLIPLYCFIAMFWALFDQTSTQWVHQAQNPLTNKWVSIELMWVFSWKFEILPSQIQAANPLLILILIPLFSFWIYPAINSIFTLTPLRKIGIGLFLTVPAFILPGWVESHLAAGTSMHINWQVLAYVIITAAEVMVSITALEFSYTQSPPKMKSFIMGLFLLSVFAGNLFTAVVNYFIEYLDDGMGIQLTGPNYYWFFSVCMFLTAVFFVFWSRSYQGETFLQGNDQHDEPEPKA